MSKTTRQEGPWWRRLLRRDGRSAEERQLADIGYQPQVNQVRHEPMPASEHDDQRQEAIVRNEELGVPGREQQASPLYESGDQEPGR